MNMTTDSEPRQGEKINDVWFENNRIHILTNLPRVLSRPLEAFPTLLEASERERENHSVYLRGQAIRWEGLDEDIHITSFFEHDEPDSNNEIGNLFRRFPQLNVGAIAQQIGIDKSLLIKFIHGMKTPSTERLEDVKSVLRQLGQSLCSI